MKITKQLLKEMIEKEVKDILLEQNLAKVVTESNLAKRGLRGLAKALQKNNFPNMALNINKCMEIVRVVGDLLDSPDDPGTLADAKKLGILPRKK